MGVRFPRRARVNYAHKKEKNLTLVINATVKSIEPSADGLSDVITLEAHVDDSWDVSYKNDFNEISTYPVKGIIANTEGSVTSATIQITVTAQELSELDLVAGSHLSFSSHFQRKTLISPAVDEVVSVQETQESVEEPKPDTLTEEAASTEETASSDTEEKSTEEVSTQEAPASTEETTPAE